MKNYLAVIARGLTEAPAVRVLVGSTVWDAVYDGLKQHEERTGKWMRWSVVDEERPNLLVQRTPVVLDVALAQDAIVYERSAA